MKFDRNKHVFHSPDFEEVIKDTIRFFNGTPIQTIPVSERFHGTGVYALYCISKTGIYRDFHEINRTSYHIPIYIGKAVPKGWRKSRASACSKTSDCELYTRIREHGKSLEQATGLRRNEFCCRFIILEKAESPLIGTVEAALIQLYEPIWNSLIDGFGNHDPGSGRYEQAMSDWDVCHPGRPWAKKCKGIPKNKKELLAEIEMFMNKLKGRQ